MKQRDNASMPSMGSTLINNSDITDNEIVYQLLKTSKTARMLLSKKRSFLKDVLQNKKDLLHQSSLLDAVIDTQLHDAIGTLLPDNIRTVSRAANNTELSNIIAKLFPPFMILRNYIMSQYEEENRKKANLRSSTKESNATKRTPVLVLLDDAHEIYEKLQDDAYSHRAIPIENFGSLVNLTPHMCFSLHKTVFSVATVQVSTHNH